MTKGCISHREACQGRKSTFWACFQTAGVRNCRKQSPKDFARGRIRRNFLAASISRSSMKGCVDYKSLHPEERLSFQDQKCDELLPALRATLPRGES
jgi:hypothetical protein